MFTRKGAVQRLFLCLLSTFALAACRSNAGTGSCPATHIDYSARVKHVHDGDTLQLIDGRKVRLIGIDTPELARKHRPAHPFAKQARDTLRRLIAVSDHDIQLQFGSEHKDKYGRLLAHVFDRQGNNLNASMISEGLAIAFTTPPNASMSECYTALDRAAMQQQSGFWQHPRYQVVTMDHLLDVETGFHRLEAHIDRVRLSSRGGWLDAGALGIHIRARDLSQFDQGWLRSLQGKRIIVRGWLRKDRYHPDNKRYLPLRHPSAIESVR